MRKKKPQQLWNRNLMIPKREVSERELFTFEGGNPGNQINPGSSRV